MDTCKLGLNLNHVSKRDPDITRFIAEQNGGYIADDKFKYILLNG